MLKIEINVLKVRYSTVAWCDMNPVKEVWNNMNPDNVAWSCLNPVKEAKHGIT